MSESCWIMTRSVDDQSITNLTADAERNVLQPMFEGMRRIGRSYSKENMTIEMLHIMSEVIREE